MTVRVQSRLGGRVQADFNRTPLRGYAASRRAYDQRRRQGFVDVQDRDAFRDYAELVRHDPCSLCMGHCGQMAADHIVALDQGGQNRWDNLTAAGRPCNAAKKDRPLLVFLATRRRDG